MDSELILVAPPFLFPSIGSQHERSGSIDYLRCRWGLFDLGEIDRACADPSVPPPSLHRAWFRTGRVVFEAIQPSLGDALDHCKGVAHVMR